MYACYISFLTTDNMYVCYISFLTINLSSRQTISHLPEQPERAGLGGRGCVLHARGPKLAHGGGHTSSRTGMHLYISNQRSLLAGMQAHRELMVKLRSLHLLQIVLCLFNVSHHFCKSSGNRMIVPALSSTSLRSEDLPLSLHVCNTAAICIYTARAAREAAMSLRMILTRENLHFGMESFQSCEVHVIDAVNRRTS